MATQQDQTPTTNIDPTALTLSRAIRSAETSLDGDYNSVTKEPDGTISKGAYQFNGNNFQSWAKQYNLDPNDFSPENQDKLAYMRIKSLLDEGKSQSEIAAMWNGAKNVGGKMVANNPDYAQKIKDNYERLAQQYQSSSSNFVNLPTPQYSSPSDTTDTSTDTTEHPYGASNPASENDTLGGGILKTVENIPSSALNLGKNIVSGVSGLIQHPVKSFEGAVNTVGGAIQEGGNAIASAVTGKNLNQTTPQTEAFDKVKNYIGSRYGSLDNLRKTVENDPVGVLMDASTVLSGTGAVVGGVGDVADVSKLSEAGNVLSKAGDVVNPVSLAAKGVGATTGLIGKGVIGADNILKWANKAGLGNFTLAQMATAYVAEMFHAGFVADAIAATLEPHIAKLVDWASAKGSSGLIGAGNAISKTAPIVGTVGQGANINQGLLRR